MQESDFPTGERINKVEVWYFSLPPKEQEEFLKKLGERHQKYYDSIIPKKGAPVPIAANSPEEAEKVVIMEAYYKFLRGLFSQERLAIRHQEQQGTLPPSEAIQTARAGIESLLTPLQAVITNGDWTMIKQNWRTILTPPQPPSQTGSVQSNVALKAYYENSLAKYHNLAAERDLDTARRIIGLIPDKTNPLDPRQIDPYPFKP